MAGRAAPAVPGGPGGAGSGGGVYVGGGSLTVSEHDARRQPGRRRAGGHRRPRRPGRHGRAARSASGPGSGPDGLSSTPAAPARTVPLGGSGGLGGDGGAGLRRRTLPGRGHRHAPRRHRQRQRGPRRRRRHRRHRRRGRVRRRPQRASAASARAPAAPAPPKASPSAAAALTPSIRPRPGAARKVGGFATGGLGGDAGDGGQALGGGPLRRRRLAHGGPGHGRGQHGRGRHGRQRRARRQGRQLRPGQRPARPGRPVRRRLRRRACTSTAAPSASINSTVALNTQSGGGSVGGALQAGGTVKAVSTLFAGNGAGRLFRHPRLPPTRLIQAAPSTDTITGSGNLLSVDPKLATAGLANNGGPTQTIALQAGSPAFGAGSNPENFATDQRGYGPRTGPGGTDIGAVQHDASRHHDGRDVHRAGRGDKGELGRHLRHRATTSSAARPASRPTTPSPPADSRPTPGRRPPPTPVPCSSPARRTASPPSGTPRTSFTVNVNLADGQAHDLELYFLDWDNKGRSEQVQLSDATTGTVLDTETISSFTNGVYLDWKVSGNVLITITRTGRGQCRPQRPVPRPDVIADAHRDRELPRAGRDDAGELDRHLRRAGLRHRLRTRPASRPTTPSPPAASRPTPGRRPPPTPAPCRSPARRTASPPSGTPPPASPSTSTSPTARPTTWSCTSTTGTTRAGASRCRSATPPPGTVLDTETISSFTNGVYLDWKVSGNVLITITRQAGANAVLNGLFLDPTSSASTATASFLEQDATTAGELDRHLRHAGLRHRLRPVQPPGQGHRHAQRRSRPGPGRRPPPTPAPCRSPARPTASPPSGTPPPASPSMSTSATARPTTWSCTSTTGTTRAGASRCRSATPARARCSTPRPSRRSRTACTWTGRSRATC